MNVRNAEECSNARNCSKRRRDKEENRHPRAFENALRKCKIFEKFSFNEIAFLGNVVTQFQEKTDKSVNTPAFCTIILKRLLLLSGHAKTKSWKSLRSASPKSLQPGSTQNGRSTRGVQTQPSFCFKLITFLTAACRHCLCFHGTASRAFTIFLSALCSHLCSFSPYFSVRCAQTP